MSDVVLTARNLVRHYPARSRGPWRTSDLVHALDGVSLELRAGETLGIVGESGCGKSTLARILALLDTPTSGELEILGTPTLRLSDRQRRRMRRHVQMVFQDPYTSLNPRMTIGEILQEPFDVHGDAVPRRERPGKVRELLELVGLKADFVDRYPHQFSGGQRQRVGIARALALRPRVVICDEPVSALDVSVQAQIVNLLSDLRDELGVAFVFVSHDLGIVRQIADRVAVMYLGRVCEQGTTETVLQTPEHPYTAALLSASPDPERPEAAGRIVLRGEVPTPIHPPTGCRFHPRCWKAGEECSDVLPALEARGTAGNIVACHFPE